MEAITSFSGAYRFLSNFYPCVVRLDGLECYAVENAYQAAKTLDPAMRRAIVRATPGAAKALGRRVDLRVDWEAVKITVMRDLIAQKFAIPHLGAALLVTYPRELIEGNTWGDLFWGVCNGEGANWLGKLLMERREALRTDGR